jgi:tetratricopeptide (TPR) repeat protein
MMAPNSEQARSRVRASIITSVFAVLAMALPTAARAAEAGASPDVERAAVAGDFGRVSQLLDKETGQLPAVSRMLKAHAYLASNRSNGALCLLLDTAAPADREAWAVWTERLLKQNPKSPAAAYLRGDALARLRQWPEADKAFTQAAAGKKKDLDLLIRVARATAQATQKDWKVASVAAFGLGDAIKKNEPLAELYTTHGYLMLLSAGSAGTIARDDFERANQLSQEAEKSPSISALQGLAFANAMLGQWEDAKQDLSKAARIEVSCKSVVEPVLAFDETLLENASARTVIRALAVSAGVEVKPGMSIHEMENAVSKNNGKLNSNDQKTLAKAQGQLNTTSKEIGSSTRKGNSLGDAIWNVVTLPAKVLSKVADNAQLDFGYDVRNPAGGTGKGGPRTEWHVGVSSKVSFGPGGDQTKTDKVNPGGDKPKMPDNSKAIVSQDKDNQRIVNQTKGPTFAPTKENDTKFGKSAVSDNSRIATPTKADNIDQKKIAGNPPPGGSSAAATKPGGVKTDPLCGKGGTASVAGSCPAPQPGDLGIVPMFEVLYSPGEPQGGKAAATTPGRG